MPRQSEIINGPGLGPATRIIVRSIVNIVLIYRDVTVPFLALDSSLHGHWNQGVGSSFETGSNRSKIATIFSYFYFGIFSISLFNVCDKYNILLSLSKNLISIIIFLCY